MAWLVDKVCSRACEKTNQKRFQENINELVSERIKVWGKQKVSFEMVRKRTYYQATNQTFDPKTFLMVVKQKALEKFQSQTKERLVLKARMEKVSPTDGSSIFEVRNFQSKTVIVLESTNLDEL